MTTNVDRTTDIGASRHEFGAPAGAARPGLVSAAAVRRREVLVGLALLGRAEHALDLVEDTVEGVAGGVAAGEVQRPAGAGALAADADAAAAEVEGAARAAGAGRGGGLGLGALGLGEDREEGVPFGFRVVRGVGEGGAEEIAVAAGDQRGEAEELAERQGLGGGQVAVEVTARWAMVRRRARFWRLRLA